MIPLGNNINSNILQILPGENSTERFYYTDRTELLAVLILPVTHFAIC